MILNEDYFKDIEITDDDIDNASNEVDETIDSINAGNSKFNCTMQFDWGCYDKINAKKYFNVVCYRLQSLLDVYGIDHSDVYVFNTDFMEKCWNKGSNYNIKSFIEHKNNFIQMSTAIEEDYQFRQIVIYINKPKFSNIKSLLNFFNGILKISINQNNDRMFYRLLIYNFFYPFFTHRRSVSCRISEFADTLDDYIKSFYKLYKNRIRTGPEERCANSLKNLITFFMGTTVLNRFTKQFENYKKGQPIDYSAK